MIGSIHRKIFCETEYGHNWLWNTLVRYCLLYRPFIYFTFSCIDYIKHSSSSTPLTVRNTLKLHGGCR